MVNKDHSGKILNSSILSLQYFCQIQQIVEDSKILWELEPLYSSEQALLYTYIFCLTFIILVSFDYLSIFISLHVGVINWTRRQAMEISVTNFYRIDVSGSAGIRRRFPTEARAVCNYRDNWSLPLSVSRGRRSA